MQRFLAVIVLIGVLLVSCTSQPKPIGWSPLRVSNIPPLFHSGVAYNTSSNEAVVFGGITTDTWSDETWIWNGDKWLRANSLTKPSAREKTAMAYDESRDKVVLFGGALGDDIFADTWEWDGNRWQSLTPIHKPPARCCHALAYDSVQKKVLLYGGWNHTTGEFFNDTWQWDGKDWTEVSCCEIPLSAAHTLVNFTDENKVIAVPSTEFTNTWTWDGVTWREVSVRPDPSRADGRSAYYSLSKRVVFFGGNRDGTLLNDTWVFDGQKWDLVNLPTQPPARYGHMMFYDVKRQSIILFGGAGDEGLLQDMWELNLPEDLSSLFSATPSAP
jgi:hypothetical protein